MAQTAYVDSGDAIGEFPEDAKKRKPKSGLIWVGSRRSFRRPLRTSGSRGDSRYPSVKKRSGTRPESASSFPRFVADKLPSEHAPYATGADLASCLPFSIPRDEPQWAFRGILVSDHPEEVRKRFLMAMLADVPGLLAIYSLPDLRVAYLNGAANKQF